jgi:hypothetical protein
MRLSLELVGDEPVNYVGRSTRSRGVSPKPEFERDRGGSRPDPKDGRSYSECTDLRNEK